MSFAKMTFFMGATLYKLL